MKWRGISETEAEQTTASLREELAERKRLMELYVPADTRAINERATEELRNSGVVDRALTVGDVAPEFTLADQDGQTVSSTALLRKGPLVVAFLRGRWCPFCCGEAEALNRMLPEFDKAGATLVAISPQSVKQAYFMHNQHKLRYPLLVDEGNKAARQFGIVYRVPEYQQQLFSSVFINLPHVNGDESWELPLAATFVVGRDRKIVYAWVNADYTQRAEPAEVVAALREV
ncbi:MAG TPA: peroxiredoxin-like family protein [Terriglobales bacterium]|nr:peroxiredoxin-like family protein [Terriglobales bacterium]